MKKLFGWLTPSGRFVECHSYQHLRVATNDPEMSKIGKIANIIEELQDLEDSHTELADREGSHNAEWHIYEMACDKAGPKIVKELYRAKYIRVGSRDDHLHFEGFPNVLKSEMQRCKDFAEQNGMEATFDPQRSPK